MKRFGIAKFLFVLWCILLGTLFLIAIWFPRDSALTASSPADSLVAPTQNPLAEPTLSAKPSQAEYGAQVYWLHCMACHGNIGQGLTTEFRQLYPQDHQDCWKSGCHGHRPYTNGFILPTVVPPVIGNNALNKFPTAAALYDFISTAMPFQAPGTLKSEQYYQIVAFLLRQNGLWNGTAEIDATNAAQISISIKNTNTSVSNVPHSTEQQSNGSVFWVILVGFGLLILVLFIFLVLRKKIKT